VTIVVWNDVFLWVGRIVCLLICLTPVWIVLYWVLMIGGFTGAWPWDPITNRIEVWRLKRRLQQQPPGEE
jgi:hypothetical protein